MSVTTRDWGVIVGALVLLVTGYGLIAAPPGEPTTPPSGSVSIEDCEHVQVAVYELDDETPDERDLKRYTELTDRQQTVFDEGRAGNGDFVRFHDADRMAAADALPNYVAFDGRKYRANSFPSNCFDRPWYAGLTRPIGCVLAGIGFLVGTVFSWRRITY